MKIESECIYRHDEYDEVLVLGIHRRYDSFDTDEQTGTEDGIYVKYAREWDGYGAMFGSTRFDPIDEFLENVREERQQFDRVTSESQRNE